MKFEPMKPAPPVTRMRCMLRLRRDCNRSARERPRRYNAPAMDAPPVQYVTTSDGFNIAYTVSGEGEPFVMMPLFFSHIQLCWTSELFMRPWFEGLAARFTLVYYDGRGQGMSSRGLERSEEHTSEL